MTTTGLANDVNDGNPTAPHKRGTIPLSAAITEGVALMQRREVLGDDGLQEMLNTIEKANAFSTTSYSIEGEIKYGVLDESRRSATTLTTPPDSAPRMAPPS